MNNKLISLFIAVLLLNTIGIMPQVSAGDADWNNQLFFSVSNSGASATNVVVELELIETAGSSTGTTIYLGADTLRADRYDLRFNNSDGDMLPFYIERGSTINYWGATVTYAYINVGTVGGAATEYYSIEYNRPDQVASLANASTTFTWFSNCDAALDTLAEWDAAHQANGELATSVYSGITVANIVGLADVDGTAWANADTQTAPPVQMWWVSWPGISPETANKASLIDEGLTEVATYGAFVNALDAGVSISYFAADTRNDGLSEWSHSSDKEQSNTTNEDWVNYDGWTFNHLVYQATTAQFYRNHTSTAKWVLTLGEPLPPTVGPGFIAHSWSGNVNAATTLMWVGTAKYYSGITAAFVEMPPTVDDVSIQGFTDDNWGWLNLTVTDLDGYTDLTTVTLVFNTTSDKQTFTLSWTQATDVFYEVSDASSVCTLSSNSTSAAIDSNSILLSFRFKITGAEAGYVALVTTTVDDSSNSVVRLYSFLYDYSYYDLIVQFLEDIGETLGIDLLSGLLSILTTLKVQFTGAVTGAVGLLLIIYSIVTTPFTWARGWLARMITTTIQLVTIVIKIINGTQTGIGTLTDIWALFEFSTWGFDFLPIIILITWFDSLDKRWRQGQGFMTTALGDLQQLNSILQFFWYWTQLAIEWVASLANTLWGWGASRLAS